MVDRLGKILAPLARRIRLLAGRAVIRLVTDSLKEQTVQLQLLDGETGEAERYQHYGFTSHPHPGAEAIVLAPGGNREHLIVVADGDRRYRLKNLSAGEVAIYTDEGDSVILRRGRIAEINTETLRVTAATKVEFISPLVEATGEIMDRRDTGGRTMMDMRNVYDDHNHPGDSGGATGVPNQPMD